MKRLSGIIGNYHQDGGFGFIVLPNTKRVYFKNTDVQEEQRHRISKGASVNFIVQTYADGNMRAFDIFIGSGNIDNAYYDRAILHKHNENYIIAKQLFEEGIKEFPQPKIYDQYALMEIDRDNYSRALKIFERGIRKFPNDPALLFNIGKLHWKIGNLDDAITYIKRCLSSQKHQYQRDESGFKNYQSIVEFSLGKVFLEMGPEHYPEAARLFGSALRMNRGDKKIEQHLKLMRHLLDPHAEKIVKDALYLLHKNNFIFEWFWRKRDHFVDIEVITHNKVLTTSYGMVHRILVRVLIDETYAQESIFDIKKTLEKPISAPFRKINTSIAFLISENNSYGEELTTLGAEGTTIIPIERADIERLLSSELSMMKHISSFITQIDLFEEKNPIVDLKKFFGREDTITNLTNSLKNGSHVGAFGLRKIGKTSLINKLKENFPHDLVAHIDVQDVPIKDAYYLYIDVIKLLAKDFIRKYPESREDIKLELAKIDYFEADKEKIPYYFKENIHLLLSKIKGNKIFIFLDEADILVPRDESDEGYSNYIDFFRMLRGISQSTNKLFSLISSPDSYICTTSKWEKRDNPIFQFYTEYFLANFSLRESNEMIQAIGKNMAIEFDEDSLSNIYKLCGGHPYITRQFCGIISMIENERPLTVTNKIVEKAITIFFKNKFAILSEIMERLDTDSMEVLKVISSEGNEINEAMIKENLDIEKISEILNRLGQYHIISEEDEHYRIAIGLLDQWIKTNWLVQ